MPRFSFVTKYFKAARFADDRSPIWRLWVSDGEQAMLINPISGRVHAYVRHDGCGKYYPTIILPLWRALPLIWNRAGSMASVLPFPRLAVDFFRIKSSSIALAQRYIEDVLKTGAGPVTTVCTCGAVTSVFGLLF